MTRTSRRTGAVLAASLAVAVVAAGCGSSKTSTSPASSSAGSTSPTASASQALSGTITVYAAASLTGSFTTLGEQFELAHPGTTIKFDFGASSTLAQQIIAGAPADVFASAAVKNMQQVITDGEIESSTNFATNTAEIAVNLNSQTKVTSIQDLGKSGVTVATCQTQVPCGALATTVLQKAGVQVTPKTQGLDVKSTLAYVTSGQVDAAIVYRTDVLAAGATVAGVAIPESDNASTQYPIATVKGSKDGDLAKAFVAYVESTDGRAVLMQAGFTVA